MFLPEFNCEMSELRTHFASANSSCSSLKTLFFLLRFSFLTLRVNVRGN